jgi:hypothetical protein
MQAILRRAGPLLLVVVLAIATASCECKAILTATKTEPTDLTFSVAGGGGFCGDTVTIGTIEAYRGPTFEHVWQVESEGKEPPALSTLTYGRVPPGFVERRAAAPLAVGDDVYINVYGPGYRGKIHVVVGKPAR